MWGRRICGFYKYCALAHAEHSEKLLDHYNF
jgi:hypothetical protein